MAHHRDRDFESEDAPAFQRFSRRSANAKRAKMTRTAVLRTDVEAADVESLPVGRVVQVHSLFCDVLYQAQTYRAVVRKTVVQLGRASVIVGDLVRFRPGARGPTDEGPPQAVIEQVLPRTTVLTRADSFKGLGSQPIVANAGQMLIVVSLLEPAVKWGLVDRILVAGRSGGLKPVVCLNKTDLGTGSNASTEAEAALEHYRSMGIAVLRTSVATPQGVDELRSVLAGNTTVLCGPSGAGKSSLIRAVQPSIDLRIGAISGYTGKGRHTTTSARRYVLDFGGEVIDTPGVKVFGLWNVTRENLMVHFPDVAAGTAPAWRRESCRRIAESLAED